MKFGYARVSSESQNLERPELQKLLQTVHVNDEIVVLDLDRLGRNNNDITKVMNQIREKQATFRVISLPSFEGVANPNLKALLNNLIIETYSM